MIGVWDFILGKFIFFGKESINFFFKSDGLYWNYLIFVDGGRWY